MYRSHVIINHLIQGPRASTDSVICRTVLDACCAFCKCRGTTVMSESRLIHTDILVCVASVKARQPDIACLLETVQEEVNRMYYSCKNLIKTVCLMISVFIGNTG